MPWRPAACVPDCHSARAFRSVHVAFAFSGRFTFASSPAAAAHLRRAHGAEERARRALAVAAAAAAAIRLESRCCSVAPAAPGCLPPAVFGGRRAPQNCAHVAPTLLRLGLTANPLRHRVAQLRHRRVVALRGGAAAAAGARAPRGDGAAVARDLRGRLRDGVLRVRHRHWREEPRPAEVVRRLPVARLGRRPELLADVRGVLPVHLGARVGGGGARRARAPIAGGSGIPEVVGHWGCRVPGLRTRTLLAKTVGVLCSVASGLVLGKEAMIHTGAIVAAGLSQGSSKTCRLRTCGSSASATTTTAAICLRRRRRRRRRLRRADRRRALRARGGGDVLVAAARAPSSARSARR